MSNYLNYHVFCDTPHLRKKIGKYTENLTNISLFYRYKINNILLKSELKWYAWNLNQWVMIEKMFLEINHFFWGGGSLYDPNFFLENNHFGEEVIYMMQTFSLENDHFFWGGSFIWSKLFFRKWQIFFWRGGHLWRGSFIYLLWVLPNWKTFHIAREVFIKREEEHIKCAIEIESPNMVVINLLK